MFALWTSYGKSTHAAPAPLTYLMEDICVEQTHDMRCLRRWNQWAVPRAALFYWDMLDTQRGLVEITGRTGDEKSMG